MRSDSSVFHNLVWSSECFIVVREMELCCGVGIGLGWCCGIVCVLVADAGFAGGWRCYCCWSRFSCGLGSSRCCFGRDGLVGHRTGRRMSKKTVFTRTTRRGIGNTMDLCWGCVVVGGFFLMPFQKQMLFWVGPSCRSSNS